METVTIATLSLPLSQINTYAQQITLIGQRYKIWALVDLYMSRGVEEEKVAVVEYFGTMDNKWGGG